MQFLIKEHAVTIDEDDYEKLKDFRWYVSKHRNTYYVYRNLDHSKSMISMHREIMGLLHGDERKVDHKDHKDHNGLNNSRSNLRVCTTALNNGNQVKRETTTSSQFKGVSWNKKNKKWLAKISGQYLGCFDNEVDAAKAYDNEAEKVFGNFALKNF